MCVLVECLPDDNQDDGATNRASIATAWYLSDEGFRRRGSPHSREYGRKTAARCPLCGSFVKREGRRTPCSCHSRLWDDELDTAVPAVPETKPAPDFTCDRPNPEEEGFCRATCDENQPVLRGALRNVGRALFLRWRPRQWPPQTTYVSAPKMTVAMANTAGS